MKRTGNAVGKQSGTPARKKKSAKKPKSKPLRIPLTIDQAVGSMLKSPHKKKSGK